MSILDNGDGDGDRGTKATCLLLLLRRALRKQEWHIDSVLPRVAMAGVDRSFRGKCRLWKAVSSVK
jgi:hypothetical protein